MQKFPFSILIVTCLVTFTFLSGCTSISQNEVPSRLNEKIYNQSSNSETGLQWMTIPITDAITGRQTTISDLAAQGKTVIIHTFAVWCPACSMQLRETKKLYLNNPGEFIILGVDIDPRENTAQVKNHIEKNKFEGIYVTAPQEFTKSLIKTVGTQVVQSLPQTIIIRNQSATYIGDGVFPESKLKVILSQLPQ